MNGHVGAGHSSAAAPLTVELKSFLLSQTRFPWNSRSLAQGLRGEVSIDVRTDIPESRLAVGTQLTTKPAERGPLTVARTRVGNGRWYVLFEESHDRSSAEALNGTELIIEVEESDEEDAWYTHELVGLDVQLTDGTSVGKVVGLEHLPAQDALVLKEKNGTRTYLPFLERFVPVVDIEGGFVTITPPGGLLSTDVVNLIISDETTGSSATAASDDTVADSLGNDVEDN
jgi:16S rRNA processing protein RimM